MIRSGDRSTSVEPWIASDYRTSRQSTFSASRRNRRVPEDFPTVLACRRNLPLNSSSKFCLDSGATTNVVDQRGLLHDFHAVVTSVRGVGGSTTSTGYGELRLQVVSDQGRRITLSFSKTLCVPGSPNLLSIPRLIDGGAEFTITEPGWAVLTVGPNTISAPRCGGLYIVHADPVVPGTLRADKVDLVSGPGASGRYLPGCAGGVPPGAVYQGESMSMESGFRAEVVDKGAEFRESDLFDGTLEELHDRDRHSSLSVMQAKLRDGGYRWVSLRLREVLRRAKSLSCEFCPHGKLTRRAQRRSDRPTETLRFHSDTYGPCPTSYVSKCKYAVIYIHQPTDFWFLFGLGSRSSEKVLSAFRTAYLLALKHGHDVRALLTDNGREYTAEAFDQYLADHGILRQYSAPGRQDQNGKSERSWRTMSESAVTYFAQSGLGRQFWLYAFSYVVFWRNRSGQESPFEKFFGYAPDLPQQIPFGCLVTYLRYDAGKAKLDSRARRGVYLGPVSAGRRSHHVLSLETGRVVTRSEKDCSFLSAIFPRGGTESAGDQPDHVGSGPMDSHFSPEGVISTSSSGSAVHADQPLQKQEVEEKYPQDPQPSAQDQGPDHFQPEQVPPERRRSSRVRSPPVDNYAKFMPERRKERPDQHQNPEEEINFTTEDDDSPSYRQALESSEADSWLSAIDEELANQKKRKTFIMVKTPQFVTLIGSVWVFKKKRGRDGSVARFKARLCAAGNMQVKGDSYDLTFAPTPKMTSLRIFAAFATSRSWTITQLDVVCAFLIPALPKSDKIYMRPPPGMTLPTGYSLLLLRALYGLHQSPRLWNAEINKTLKSIGFVPTDADPCVYTMSKGSSVIAAFIIHVDDCLVAAEKDLAEKLAKELMTIYEMTHQGTPTWVLGLAVDYDLSKGVLKLSQQGYVQQLLSKYNMENCNTAKTPTASIRLTASTEPMSHEESEEMKNIPYRNLVGALLYAMLSTRPDIAFAVIQVAKFSSAPSRVHWTAAKRILRYLKGTQHYGITYTRNGSEFDIQGYTDSDWAGCVQTRRSTGGYLFTVLGGALSWKAFMPGPVAQSSCVAELMALDRGAREAVWLRKMLRALGVNCDRAMVLHQDNQSAIAIASNQKGMSSRTKHVATRYFAVRQFVEDGEIVVEYIMSANQLADIFTKPLAAIIFCRLVLAMGLHPQLP